MDTVTTLARLEMIQRFQPSNKIPSTLNVTQVSFYLNMKPTGVDDDLIESLDYMKQLCSL